MKISSNLRLLASLFFLFWGLAHSAQAQDKFRPLKKVVSYIEVTGGISNLKNTGYLDDHMITKYGYSWGIGVGHSFSDRFTLSIRALSEKKGSNTEQQGSGISPEGYSESFTTRQTDYNYLTLALLPAVHVGSKRNFSLGAGGYYSFLLGNTVREQTETRSSNIIGLRRRTIHDVATVNYDAGIAVFAGYSFPLYKGTTGSVQLFYNKGLVEIEDNWNGYQRNNSVTLMFAVRIPYGKI